MIPTRPALRWWGGKWQLAPWIISHFPPHSAYCEPYGGAASVLLRKPPVPIETFNDRHGRLVNFFRMLRDREAELLRAVQLTPFARAEFELSSEPAADPLEDARRFYVLAQQGRVGAASRRHRSGWRYVRADTRYAPTANDFDSIDHLHAVAHRLKRVQLECDDAPAILTRYDDPEMLFYVDPPYVFSTRAGWDRYHHELTDDDHRDLAEQLARAEGMVVVSGYPCALYEQLYAGWARLDHMAMADAGKAVVESLWLNDRARARVRQLSLLEGA